MIRRPTAICIMTTPVIEQSSGNLNRMRGQFLPERAYYKVEPNRLLRARLLSHAENLSNDFACISPEDRIGFYFVPEIRGSVAVAPISFEGCEWLLRLS